MSASLELDYREGHSLPLINSTTCFTGARRQQKRTLYGVETREGDDASDGDASPSRPQNSVATTILATELHTVAVHLEKNGTCSIESKPVLRLLPEGVNDGDRYACVGFDVLDDWQVVALMRRSAPSGSEEVAAGTSADSGAAWRGSSMSDMTALWSVATSAEDASLAAAPTSTETGPAVEVGGVSHRRTGSSSALEMNASSSGLSLLPPDQLQQLVAQSANPQVHLVVSHRHDPSIQAATCLDFRPLAPTLCRFAPSAGTGGLGASMGVWLGSADDCKLRLFALRGLDDGAECAEGEADVTLDLVSFDQCLSQEVLDMFSFRSPIMALDWCCVPSSDERQCVAVACQDGTIRVVTYSVDVTPSPESSSPIDLKDVRETTVIVDGPIVCISLFRNKASLRCIVGSLCGYACEILMLDETSLGSGAGFEGHPSSDGAGALTVGWEGPFIIAHDLWNNRLNCEDSVLCVSASSVQLPEERDLHLVAVGTHAGRCRLYGSGAQMAERRTAPSVSSYELLWECQLPYSIHGVLWLSYATSPTRSKDYSRPLLVTTRRSTHVFLLRNGVAYDSNLALARLNSLMNDASESCRDEDSSQAERGDAEADVTVEHRLE